MGSSNNKLIKVVIIGGGKVGRVLGKLLKNAGYKICAISSRRATSAKVCANFIGGGKIIQNPIDACSQGEILLLTTPDDVIERTCRLIAKGGGFRKGVLVLHTSGSLSSRILKDARKCGAYIASIHPVRSIANPKKVVRDFKGTFCGYEGNKEGLPIVRRIINDIGGVGFEIKSNKKNIYHTAGVFASNYLVSLFDIGLELLKVSGIKREIATRILCRLAMGTIENIKDVGLPKALTGPIERGDVRTIHCHLKELKGYNKFIAKIYSMLGKIAVGIAYKKGTIKDATKRKITRILASYG